MFQRERNLEGNLEIDRLKNDNFFWKRDIKMARKEILGIIILATGFFLAVGSWAHNWLAIVGSPNFGLIDFTVCILGIIMVVVGVLINRKLILS